MSNCVRCDHYTTRILLTSFEYVSWICSMGHLAQTLMLENMRVTRVSYFGETMMCEGERNEVSRRHG